MNAHRHLTEAERNDAADAVTPAEQPKHVSDHLRQCESCAADVARVGQLVTQARQATSPRDKGSDLWPEIQARIEQDKVIPLVAPNAPTAARKYWRRRAPWIGGALAAALLLVVVLPIRRGKGKANTPAVAAGATTGATSNDLALAADSARAYEREAQYLLNELEMRRAMMPPRTSSSVDRDLQIIDRAIGELKAAIVRDPNNPALRRLLAASYKQKVEMLQRAVNAG